MNTPANQPLPNFDLNRRNLEKLFTNQNYIGLKEKAKREATGNNYLGNVLDCEVREDVYAYRPCYVTIQTTAVEGMMGIAIKYTPQNRIRTNYKPIFGVPLSDGVRGMIVKVVVDGIVKITKGISNKTNDKIELYAKKHGKRYGWQDGYDIDNDKCGILAYHPAGGLREVGQDFYKIEPEYKEILNFTSNVLNGDVTHYETGTILKNAVKIQSWYTADELIADDNKVQLMLDIKDNGILSNLYLAWLNGI